MNVFLKYGSIFVVTTALVIGLMLISIKSDSKSGKNQDIATYALSNSPLLDEFKSRVNLQDPDYFLSTDQDTTELVLRYKISVNSQKPIHSIEWMALYTYQGHIIFNKEFQVIFSRGMDQHKMRSVGFIFPIESISRSNRVFFLSPSTEVKVFTLPKSIQYLDGGRFEVPY